MVVTQAIARRPATPKQTMTSLTRIILIVSFPVLAVYGSFVGLWTPSGFEAYTAEQLGWDCGIADCAIEDSAIANSAIANYAIANRNDPADAPSFLASH